NTATPLWLSPFFFSSRRRHTRFSRDWSSDVCSSDLADRYGPGSRRQLALGHDLRDLVTADQQGLVADDLAGNHIDNVAAGNGVEIGRASCREGGEVGGEGVGRRWKRSRE